MSLGGKETEAMAYIMVEGKRLNLPSDYYYEACCQGYEDNCFDLAPLEKAYKKSLQCLDGSSQNCIDLFGFFVKINLKLQNLMGRIILL